jgi:hypothetical protein
MDGKTPSDAIEAALDRLPATQLFPTEAAARDWTATRATELLRHKLRVMMLTPEQRDQADPIEAGYVHAKDLATRPRRQRIPWIDSLLDTVADACFCEVMPLSGTMSSWLIGRHTDRLTAMRLLGSLVPTAEVLGQAAYLREYHTKRKEGEVAAARGFKDVWLESFVTEVRGAFTAQLAAVEREVPSAAEQFAAARREVVSYMNENFLPTRGNRTERLRTLR